MAVDLASKYSSQVAEVFTKGSFVKGKTSTSFDLTGVKTLKVYTPITVPEVEYTRDGMSRYGAVTEMQDVVQELKMTQDKAFTLTIDRGNNLDQNMTKKAADMLRLQLNEQSTPAADKYALRRFATMAGTIETASDAPTKDNIVDLISTGAQVLDDNLVPDGDRYVYVSSEIYKMIRLSPEFTGLEGLGVKAVAKGICGEIAGLNIVRVPKSYMPEGCYFLITHKNAVLMPYKISDAKVHNDPVGVSGALIEGRHYDDASVAGREGKRRICAGRRGQQTGRTGHQEHLGYDHADGGGCGRDPLHGGRHRPALLRQRKDLLRRIYGGCRFGQGGGVLRDEVSVRGCGRRVKQRGSRTVCPALSPSKQGGCNGVQRRDVYRRAAALLGQEAARCGVF